MALPYSIMHKRGFPHFMPGIGYNVESNRYIRQGICVGSEGKTDGAEHRGERPVQAGRRE